MEKVDWERIACNILKAELAKRGLKYTDLQEKLAAIGVQQSLGSLRMKASHGTFAFTFFLQCMTAIGVTSIDISSYNS